MSKLQLSSLLGKRLIAAWIAMTAAVSLASSASASSGPIQHKPSRTHQSATTRKAYAGFDKNAYPGDDLLAALSKSFAFTGYWLNNPPGMTSNQWLGKRSFVRAQGLGFLILSNGRLDAELKAAAAQGNDPAALGRSDAAAAIAAAQREGFPARSILFLDQEEGGHLLPEQAAYLFAWLDAIQTDAVQRPGPQASKPTPYKPGVYCSGIAVAANDPATTASDILQHYTGQTPPAIWVANDQCPPAPGCLLNGAPPSPSTSGTPAAAIWQFAQSPRRGQITSGCASASYSPDNACYAPNLPHSPNTAIDLDSATSPDPSHGR